MAQLSNDCFAFGGGLRPLDAALDDLTQRLNSVVARERLALDAALGRVLAEDVVALVNVPGFDNSAVDGYAVRFDDLAPMGATILPISGRVPAGMMAVQPLANGKTARIFTGAMLPAGADTVYMQEDVIAVEGMAHLPAGLARGANCRRAGEDFVAHQRLMRAGTRLNAAELASLAATGHGAVEVFVPLKVGVLSTGNEIAAPGTRLAPGSAFDSNAILLSALLRARGMVPVSLGIAADREASIAARLARAAADCDAIVTSGGVSTGEEDHLKAALAASGRIDFWRLAIKPGRPVALGFIGQKPVIGLPGNPVAAYVTFARFAGPVLDCLAGAIPHRPRGVPVTSGFSYRKKPDRREYVRVTVRVDGSGRASVHKFEREGAALLSSLLGTDGLVELPEAMLTLDIGESVPFLAFSALTP